MGERAGEMDWEDDASASLARLLFLSCPGLNSWGVFGVLVRFGECNGERKLGEGGGREAASLLCSSLVEL